MGQGGSGLREAVGAGALARAAWSPARRTQRSSRQASPWSGFRLGARSLSSSLRASRAVGPACAGVGIEPYSLPGTWPVQGFPRGGSGPSGLGPRAHPKGTEADLAFDM